jgi:hypothetical protein
MDQVPTPTYKNHARIIPGYHVRTFGILGINTLWALYRMAAAFSFEHTDGLPGVRMIRQWQGDFLRA